MKTAESPNLTPVSLQELLENETHISQRLLVEMADAQSKLARAEKDFRWVQSKLGSAVEIDWDALAAIWSEAREPELLEQAAEQGIRWQTKMRLKLAWEALALIRSEIEERLLLGQQVEPGPLTVARTSAGVVELMARALAKNRAQNHERNLLA